MHRDLLHQAIALATCDTIGKPKQVNLRRSVSAAYYSLFHFLVDSVCRAVIGSRNDQRGYRAILARAFTHSTMKGACSSFSAGQLPAVVAKPLPHAGNNLYVIAIPIQDIAQTFKEPQQKRHLADYDPSERFKRSEVLTLINQVYSHISAFESLPLTDDRHFFLVSLLAWKEMSSRT